MGNPNYYSSLAEFILDDNDTSSLAERSQLIRILSRSSTLPKVENIFIRAVKSDPKSFVIYPGVALSIGVDYLAYPEAALLCLRYGLEWQIWYKNQPKNAKNILLCDVAACRVAAKFHELTPEVDRSSIDHLPEHLKENILKFEGNKKVAEVYPELNFNGLQKFHGLAHKTNELTGAEVEILSHLASPVEYLMMSGGDVRLNVEGKRLLNKYGCRPFPRPDAFTFASSTASSISNAAYNKAQIKRKALIRDSLKKGLFNSANALSEEIKVELKKAFHIPSSASVILASSGTDVSLQVAGICQVVFQKKPVHILVAADETGSGVPAALEGKHFSNTTSQKIEVEKGALIEGFEESEIVPITLRDEKGRLRRAQDIDKEVALAIQEVLDRDGQPILHVIDQSKLGYTSPSYKGLKNIQKQFGEELLVLVDNSQLRMDPEDIRDYLDRGCMMALTGSKFFTGPPFNGALLIPKNLVKKWEKYPGKLPKGLEDYFYESEWPNWEMASGLRKGINIGLYMRWHASISEIKRYYKTPLSLRYLGLEMFCNHVKQSIDQAEFLEHLTGFNQKTEEEYNPLKMKDRKTIFPFFIKLPDRVLTKPELDKLYKLLNKDLSDQKDWGSDEAKRIAGQECHIGQPVPAIYTDGSPSGVVRINLGARVISESWKDRDSSLFFKTIEEQMIQVDIIIRKIKLILEHKALLVG